MVVDRSWTGAEIFVFSTCRRGSEEEEWCRDRLVRVRPTAIVNDVCYAFEMLDAVVMWGFGVGFVAVVMVVGDGSSS